NRKREGDADTVFAGAPGEGARGNCAGSALRRRTEPAGGSSRVDGRSVRGRGSAVSVTAERDADVEHSGAGAGLDGAAATECLATYQLLAGETQPRLRIWRAAQTLNFYPGTQPTGQPGPSGSGFFVGRPRCDAHCE